MVFETVFFFKSKFFIQLINREKSVPHDGENRFAIK